jgi:ArsR family transcriptional regulator
MARTGLRARARSRAAGRERSDLPVPAVLGAALDPDDAAELAFVLSALSDPVRLRLVSLLSEKGEICSCDLAGLLAKSQPTVSHHTGVLARAGLVVGERRGRWVWWRLDEGRFAAVRAALGG